MKTLEELNIQLAEVSNKTKAEIIAFAKVLIEEYGVLLVIDSNVELNKLNEQNQKLIAERDKISEELVQVKLIADEAIAKFNDQGEKQSSFVKTIKIDGKEYIINHGVNFNGETLTAADIAESPSLAKELVKIGSGALTLKVEGK